MLGCKEAMYIFALTDNLLQQYTGKVIFEYVDIDVSSDDFIVTTIFDYANTPHQDEKLHRRLLNILLNQLSGELRLLVRAVDEKFSEDSADREGRDDVHRQASNLFEEMNNLRVMLRSPFVGMRP